MLQSSLRALEESESYISASVGAMVVVRCVANRRDYGKESLDSYTRDGCLAIFPAYTYSQKPQQPFRHQFTTHGPPGNPLMAGSMPLMPFTDFSDSPQYKKLSC
jgi:hypothetical protein